MAKIQFIPECWKTVQGMKNRTVLTLDGNFYKSLTIRNIENSLKQLEVYFDSLGFLVYMTDINFEFTERYRMYLIEKKLAKNTISGYMANFGMFIRRFHKIGLMSYSGVGIRSSMEVTTAIINTVDELKLLYSLELPKGQKRVVDIYVCQCFLGLRVSDMFKFIKQIKQTIIEVDEKKFFQIKTGKTGEVVVIPASKIVLKILEDYDYNFGNEFSDWYYRRTLKEVVSRTSMEREVLFHRTEGGERIERIMLFSDLMGSHTARRTFASNAYLMGLDPLDIMKITGHRSYNSFFKYIRCENLAVALRISTHEFFNIDFDQ